MVVKSYSDLCQEIEIYQTLVEQLEKEISRLMKLMYTPPQGYTTSKIDGMPRGGRDRPTLDQAYTQLQQAETELNEYRDILADKLRVRKTIEHRLKGMEGIDRQVAYLRLIEGRSYKEIASELGYSYGYVRQVGSQIKKRESM